MRSDLSSDSGKPINLKFEWQHLTSISVIFAKSDTICWLWSLMSWAMFCLRAVNQIGNSLFAKTSKLFNITCKTADGFISLLDLTFQKPRSAVVALSEPVSQRYDHSFFKDLHIPFLLQICWMTSSYQINKILNIEFLNLWTFWGFEGESKKLHPHRCSRSCDLITDSLDQHDRLHHQHK